MIKGTATSEIVKFPLFAKEGVHNVSEVTISYELDGFVGISADNLFQR